MASGDAHIQAGIWQPWSYTLGSPNLAEHGKLRAISPPNGQHFVRTLHSNNLQDASAGTRRGDPHRLRERPDFLLGFFQFTFRR